MASVSTEAVLSEARAALLEAQDLLRSPDGRERGDEGVLGLYDELRERLQRIDDERVRDLLDGLATTVQRLVRLGDDLERMRLLRKAFK